MSTSSSSTCHKSYYAPYIYRYTVAFKHWSGIIPTWEGYAENEMDAKVRAALWLERAFIKLNISEVICERTT